ncbi:MAG: hypothetical protein RSA10_01295 [Bacilli bacterium]
MKYTYDILVNFKNKAYEFYEWSKNDNVEHIKSIMTIKVSEDMFYDFFYKKVKISKQWLDNIYGKTELFGNKFIKIIDYSCVIYSDKDALAIEIDDKGNVLGKSKLLPEEADEVIIGGINENITELRYDVVGGSYNFNYFTRKEEKLIKLMNTFLSDIKKDNEQIKYLYLELFDEKENDNEKAYKKIIKHVNEADKNVLNELKLLIKVLKK